MRSSAAAVLCFALVLSAGCKRKPAPASARPPGAPMIYEIPVGDRTYEDRLVRGFYETTGGWRIRRNGRLFEEDENLINATEFHRRLSGALDSYMRELCRADWESERWKNFRIKMNATIKNCES